MKTPERAHLPSKLWQSVKLQRNYEVALQQIADELEHWSVEVAVHTCFAQPFLKVAMTHVTADLAGCRPKYIIHKNKQRLTKLTQYLTRRKKEVTREKYVLTQLISLS